MADGDTQKNYHHGDARNALLRAGAELLEEQGAAGLSLRQVSERASLSRQAPYNHFASKEALLAELASTGFSRLERELRAAVNGLVGERALVESGAAYIAFAQSAPAMFRLMFSCELVDLSRYPEVLVVAASAYAALTDIIFTLAPPSQFEDLSLAAWSMVHGYATLSIEGAIDGSHRHRERATAFARVIFSAADRANRDAFGA